MTSFHPEDVEDHLLLIASTRVQQDDGLPSKLRLKIPRSAAYFTGTGAAAANHKFILLDIKLHSVVLCMHLSPVIEKDPVY